MTMINTETMEVTGPPIHKVWEAFEDLVDKKLTKSIGLCNVNVMMLVEILAGARIKPSVVQVELHPYLQQEGLVKTCQKFGIQVTAYAPLASPGFPYNDYTKTKLLEHQTLKDIAEKHGKTTAQIALAWNLQRGVIVIPKSTNNDRINLNLIKFLTA